MPLVASSRTIVVAIPIRLDVYYLRFARAFERYASAYNYRVLITTIGHLDIANAGPDFASLLEYPISGIVLVDLPEAFHSAVAALCPPGWPIVSVGVFTFDSVDSVSVNLEAGVAEAIQFLIDTTPGRVAFFGPGIRDETSVLSTLSADDEHEIRFVVYKRLMEANERNLEVITGNRGDRRVSSMALCEYISEYDCPSAIFCHNDEMAIAAGGTLRELGIPVPGEAQIVGCDGLDEAAVLTPSLSTVEQPFTQVSAKAMELIERRIGDPDAQLIHESLNAKFVQRESTMQ
jgi:DNA-binding LacI/PurR family transcriptional regulator